MATPILQGDTSPQRSTYGSVSILQDAGSGTAHHPSQRLTHPGPRAAQVSFSQPTSIHHLENDTESIASIASYSTYSSSTGSLHGLDHGEDLEGRHPKAEDEVDVSSRHLFWTYVALSPLLLSILVLFGALLQVLPSTDTGYIIHWDRFAVGMMGWIVAFSFRTPIFALASQVLALDPYLCEWSTLLTAGMLEEVLRLGIITHIDIGSDFGSVYWLALGWAASETLYYIGQSLVYSRWFSVKEEQLEWCGQGESEPLQNGATKDLETLREAMEVRHWLGIDRPWWSLMGRTSSMMVHIGLSCWLGHSASHLLLPAAIVHGSLYVVWGVFLPDQWSIPATSYGTLIVSMAVFLIGLAVYGEIV